MSGEIRVALGPGQSIDDALLNGAVLGLSPEEVSHRIGGVLSPARVRLKTREILTAGDWLDDLERERAIQKLVEKSFVQISSMAQKSPEEYRVALQYAKALFERLDKRRAATDEDVNRLYQAQARIMAQAINLAFERAAFELQKRHPEIEDAEIRAVLAESLPEAVVLLSEHNAGEAIAA